MMAARPSLKDVHNYPLITRFHPTIGLNDLHSVRETNIENYRDLKCSNLATGPGLGLHFDNNGSIVF